MVLEIGQLHSPAVTDFRDLPRLVLHIDWHVTFFAIVPHSFLRPKTQFYFEILSTHLFIAADAPKKKIKLQQSAKYLLLKMQR